MSDISRVHLPFQNSHAFVIGNDDYQHVSKLQTAVKDAKDIATLLKDIHGYTVHTLYDASQAEMKEMFEQMPTVVKQDDRVVFYFAGHGIALDSDHDPEGYLVPVDAQSSGRETLVPMNLLHNTLLKLPCKHGLLILDCCFAGSFKWSTGFRSLFLREKHEQLYEERFLRFVQHPAWQVITSSAHDQKALDLIKHDSLGLRQDLGSGPIEGDKNSPFAFALKQAINLEGKADVVRGKRSDGVITATELYLYIREIVEEASRRQGSKQSPAIFTLSKHDTKGEFIFLHPTHNLNLPKAPDRNPYRGLSAYGIEEQDERTFFGRSEAIQAMKEKLANSSILVVSAPSGQGKSSTVKAGLFPAIRQLNGYNPEVFHVLRPGERNMHDWRFLIQLDVQEPQIILIDQYEEMFTEAEGLQTEFESLLLQLSQKLLSQGQAVPTKLILTLRSDFEWQLKISEFGKSFWQEQQIRRFLYRLPPMELDELREAMVKPAWMVAYEFESEALISQILEEIKHAPGALPLLSFTLHQLYEYRDTGRRLFTHDAYQNKLGGINGALSKHADTIYESLPDAMHKDFMRKLMLRMVRLNDGSYTRRRVYLRYKSNLLQDKVLSELDYPDHMDETVERVLEILEQTQLIVRGKDHNGPYVEPMHDSLINYWPSCLKWIQDFGRETLILQRQLWQAVLDHHQWQANAYTQPGANAPLWDNNPKLQQAQIAITDPKEEWLCEKGWGEKSISSMAWLLWQEGPLTQTQVEDLQDYVWYFAREEGQGRYGTEMDSETIFTKIREQMDLWLNEFELDFVKRSFERQQSEIERLKQQRDEAIQAKEEAEAARQRTANEMIEASWKTGTLLQATEIVQGSRELYKQLSLLMDLKKARSLSPVPIFVSGPHGDDFNLTSQTFGHYNPAFLDWAKKYVIPASKNVVLRKLTQPFFNTFMRDIARAYFMAFQYLSSHEALCKRVINEYLQYIDNLQSQRPAKHGISEDPQELVQFYGGGLPDYQYESGGLFLEARFENYGSAYDSTFNETEYYIGYYYSVSACGFWIRRHIDGTAFAFFDILQDLLRTYDPTWIDNPPEMPADIK